MSQTKKASKTNRNQPANFDETLAASINMPASISEQPRLSLRQVRLALSVVWVIAAIIAGVGVGRMISDARNVAIIAEPATPIAASKVTAAAITSGNISSPRIIPSTIAKVTPAEAIMQAQAGSIMTSVPASNLQAVDRLNSLLPGYDTNVHTQGNIGVDPVK